MTMFRALTENLSTKIFSCIVALILFLFVNVESATPTNVDFRVDYRLPEGMMLTGDPPAVLHTTLQGLWATFRTREASALHAVVIDLTSHGPGTVRYNVQDHDINAPLGMRVLAVYPSQIQLTLDRKVERLITVNADIPGQPAEGFEVRRVHIEPDRVRVIGPAKQMQALQFVSTVPIEIKDRSDDAKLNVDLRPMPAPFHLVDKAVRVVVDVEAELVERTFEVPVLLHNVAGSFEIKPESVRITLQGSKTAFEAFAASDLIAQIDGSRIGAPDKAVELPVVVATDKLPEGVQVLGPLPKVKLMPGEARRRSRK